jgi:hypothetical protein
MTQPLRRKWLERVTAKECPASSGARHVAHALALYMDREGVCWPSQATLADRTALAESTVKEKLHELRKLGLLVWKTGYGKSSNRYQALLPNREWAERRPTAKREVADSAPVVRRLSPHSGPTVGYELGELGELRPEGPHDAAPSGRDVKAPSPEVPGSTPVSQPMGEPASEGDAHTEGEVDGEVLVDPEPFITEIAYPKTKDLLPAPEATTYSDCGKKATVMVGRSAVCRPCAQRRITVNGTPGGAAKKGHP